MQAIKNGGPQTGSRNEDENLLLMLERQVPARGGLLERLPALWRLICVKHREPLLRAMLVFELGRMEGVRQERARRGG